MSKQHKNNDNDDIIEPIDTNLDDLVSASLTTKKGQLRRHPNSNNGNNLDAETGSLDATPTQILFVVFELFQDLGDCRPRFRLEFLLGVDNNSDAFFFGRQGLSPPIGTSPARFFLCDFNVCHIFRLILPKDKKGLFFRALLL